MSIRVVACFRLCKGCGWVVDRLCEAVLSCVAFGSFGCFQLFSLLAVCFPFEYLPLHSPP